jgi:hypothetical protein
VTITLRWIVGRKVVKMRGSWPSSRSAPVEGGLWYQECEVFGSATTVAVSKVIFKNGKTITN